MSRLGRLGRWRGLFTVLMLMVPLPSQAATRIWAGGTNSTFTTGANWAEGIAPGESDTVAFKGFAPLPTTGWTGTASNTNSGDPVLSALDGRRSTRWSVGNTQSTDDWFRIDMLSNQTFSRVDVDTGPDYPLQYPRGYNLKVSTDGSAFTSVATGNGSAPLVSITFAEQTARYIRIELTQASSPDWWLIAELTVWGTADSGATRLSRTGWSASASNTDGSTPVTNSIDSSLTTRWGSGAQYNGLWFKMDLGVSQTFTAFSMDSYDFDDDYPRTFQLAVSPDNSTYSNVGTTVTQVKNFMLQTFTAQTARYIRITQSGSASNWWGINDFNVYGTPSTANIASAETVASFELTKAVTVTQAAGQSLTVTGDYNQTAGTFTGGNSTVHITGDFNLSGTGAFTSTSGQLTVGGAFTNSAAFAHNGGRVMLAAASSKTFATDGDSFHDVIINDGLVGYWKLDEGSSPIADSSEYGHSGTLFNTPAWMAGPTLQFTNSNALVVNGSSQYGRVTRSPALEPAAVSVSVWVRRNGAQVNNAKVMGKTLNNNFASPYASYEIHVNNLGTDVTRVNFQTGHVGGALDMMNSTTNALPNTTWVHVVGVYDPSAGAPQKKLYVNGILNASTTVSTDLLYDATSTGDLYIGMNGGGAQYFNGAVDDLRVYGRALSANDVAALYAGDTRVTPAATQTLSGALTATGELVIVSGNLDVSAAACSAAPCAVTVGEAWRNLGGLFTPRTGTVSFTGTGGSLLSDRISFYNLTVSGAQTWTLADRLYVDNTLAMSAGTLATATYPIHAGTLNKSAGTISGSGMVVLDSGSNQSLRVNNIAAPLRIESPRESGLVGYWKLDEGRGTTAYDVSGNGNNGTMSNGAIWSASVPTSPAIPIDDAGSVSLNGTSHHVSLGNPAVLNFSGQITLAAWVNVGSSSGAERNIIAHGHSASTETSLRINGGNYQVGSWVAPSAVYQTSYAIPGGDVGAWVHLVGVYDGTTWRLYRNGTQVSSTATPQGAQTVASNWAIGSRGDGTSRWFDGDVDDVRMYNRALSANEAKALYDHGYTTGSTVVYSLAATATMAGALKLDSGILDAVSFQNSITGATTVSGGEYKIGSNTSGQTFTGGLTVNRYGELTLASSGGKAIMGADSTLTMNGTLTASHTGAAIQSASGTYHFHIGSTATATPTLNITGLQVKNTKANGMYINSDTGATTTFTRFDNIAFSLGAGASTNNYNLRIYATSLNLISSGCTFDSGSGKSVEKNVVLVGNGHTGTPDSTTTRAIFGGSTCANSVTCESYDGDDDNETLPAPGPNGLGDTTASLGSVIQWVASASTDTSGSIEGFPTAAFKWSDFSYVGTYVAYHDTNGGTADTVYVRTATGAIDYEWSTASGEEIIGTPRWDTVGSVNYVYVAVAGALGTGGKVYRLINDIINNTLLPDSASPWSGAAYSCSCTITTPLAQDINNLYWGGWIVSGSAHKLFTLVKTTRALIGTGILTTHTTNNTAPAIWSTSPTYAFMGLAGHIVKFDVTNQGMSDDNSVPTGVVPVTGRITIIFNRLYAGDDAGYLHVLNPASMAGSAKHWSYRNHASAIKSHYFDAAQTRVYFGDQDGHIMVVNSAGTTVAPFPYTTAGGAFATAPFYYTGVIAAGTTTGSLYFIDQNDGTNPVTFQTYQFGTSTAVSSIGYDPITSRYMVSTANATNKDGRLYYFAVTDPSGPI